MTNEEEDIAEFNKKSFVLEGRVEEKYRIDVPITDMQFKLSERTAIYLEFMAAAFIKETGIKASECELVGWADFDGMFHWQYRKIKNEP